MKNWLYIMIALLMLAAILFRKKIVAAVWDKISESRIRDLHPIIQDRARKFINAVERELGIRLRVTSGFRSYAEQQALYDQGRTTPGNIVTNAKPGSSFHNFGLGFDVVPIVDGEADWNSPMWPKIAAIGKRYGLKWGGDFSTIVDKPHFEYSAGRTLAQLRDLHARGKKDPDGYVLLT